MKKKRLHRGFRSQSLSDKLFDILNYGLLGLFALIILYPNVFYYYSVILRSRSY